MNLAAAHVNSLIAWCLAQEDRTAPLFRVRDVSASTKRD
jgi:hypothetical protein